MTLGDTSELTENDRMLIEHMDIAQEGNGGGMGEMYTAVRVYFFQYIVGLGKGLHLIYYCGYEGSGGSILEVLGFNFFAGYLYCRCEYLFVEDSTRSRSINESVRHV